MCLLAVLLKEALRVRGKCDTYCCDDSEKKITLIVAEIIPTDAPLKKLMKYAR